MHLLLKKIVDPPLRSVGVRSRDNQIFSDGGWVVYLISLPMVLRALRARELRH